MRVGANITGQERLAIVGFLIFKVTPR